MEIHTSILVWEIHGQRSLVGYRPRDRRESDRTERLSPAQALPVLFTFSQTRSTVTIIVGLSFEKDG